MPKFIGKKKMIADWVTRFQIEHYIKYYIKIQHFDYENINILVIKTI